MAQDIDWGKLSGSLSESALNALKEHLSGSTEQQSTPLITSLENKAVNVVDKDFIAESNADYKEREYWENRFADEENYEWLLSYSQIRPYISPYINHSDNILVIGCGNSTLSLDLYDNGYKNITSIDFSSKVIEKMKQKSESSNRHEMKWLEMDMLNMYAFDASCFDVIIDKATMDAIMVDEGDPWNPNENCILQADMYCKEMSRVLKPGGILLQISFAQPHFRSKYLMGAWVNEEVGLGSHPSDILSGMSLVYSWELSYVSIAVEAGCLNSYLYTMRKSNS
jgi:SAM-dependent methyltransferase